MTDTGEIGRGLGTDYFLIRESLSEREIDLLDRTRRFVDEEVLPVIVDHWERAEFPRDLARRLGELGLIGDGIEDDDVPEMSPLAAGLVNMELNRGDGSLGTFLGVQAGLAMRSIADLGSAEQQRRWLGPLARAEAIGAFALTEPDHGSDSVGLETAARREGEEWVLEGRKRWIGNATVADVVVVWARDTDDGEVKGFLVEPASAEGFEATRIEAKGSVRAVWQADIELDGVRVAESSRLPGAESFADTSKVLAATRLTCAFSALGHAVGAYEAALTYALERKQFGKPLVAFQTVQRKLVDMLADVTGMQLYCLQCARLNNDGKLRDTFAGLAKMNNTTKARGVIAQAREVLGGNGILLDNHVIRHMVDIESIHTFEGTADIQALIVGRDVTGVSAFV
ncbi:acyl-CoA dehydrogenase [Thermoleophilia bacterium SCSIO 60948]|nr:acyl-CoA dehydrogenase [Thermoleophilia bacterium SCSIO 60948]